MKKRVLIITEHFAPENTVLAVRPTKTAKYLTRAGFAVTVLTAPPLGAKDPTLNRDLSECGRVLRVRGTEKSTQGGLFSRLALFFRSLFFRPSFYRACVSYVEHAHLDLSQFDVILSAYATASAHRAAYYLKKKCPTLRWIADFRAPASPSLSKFLRARERRLTARLLSRADLVSAAGEGTLKSWLAGVRGVPGVCIPNGFDPEDLPALPENKSEKPFTVLLSGAVKPGERDLFLVLEAAELLLKSGRIRRDQIRLDYYGDQGAPLQARIDEMEFAPHFYLHGKVTKQELFAARSEAQVIAVSAWESTLYPAPVPERFFELLPLSKPILAVVSGDRKNTEFARLIRTLRLGCVYESASDESLTEVCRFLAESYTYWRTRFRELYEPDEKKCRMYDYSVLARRWAQIMEEI